MNVKAGLVGGRGSVGFVGEDEDGGAAEGGGEGVVDVGAVAGTIAVELKLFVGGPLKVSEVFGDALLVIFPPL